MATHKIMDHSGHRTVEFDKADPAALKLANERFMELVRGGHTAATRKAGEKDYDVIRDPSLQRDETVFAPQLKGG